MNQGFASNRVNSEALDRLREVFRRDKASVCSQFSEWFYTYHADLYVHGVPFDVYVRKVEAIRRELGDAARVLDLGSGFGVYACLLRILGANQVVALDYHDEKSRNARALALHLGVEGVTFLQGDALALPFRDGTFDGALALASLSHIREPGQAVVNLGRALRPGSRLYVFEDNNSQYPGYEANMSRIWEGAESGHYEGDVPSEKQLAESYVEIRRRMIRDRFPALSADALDLCAKATRGLYGRHLFKAVEEYQAKGKIDNPRKHHVCHPVSGEYEEYPLNPKLVKQMLREAGFEPRMKSPHQGPFRGRFRFAKRLAAGIYSLCPILLTRTSPTFSVVGTRR